jgi:hypothetical protein
MHLLLVQGSQPCKRVNLALQVLLLQELPSCYTSCSVFLLLLLLQLLLLLAGSSSIIVSGTKLSWAVGGKLTVTSSSYNWKQAETRSILAAVEAPSSEALAAAGYSESTAGIYDSLAAATPAPGAAESSTSGAAAIRQYNVTLFTLDQPLEFDHHARITDWEGFIMDMRPEVAYLTSNSVIKAADGPAQVDGEKFGVRVLASGSSLLQLDSVAIAFGGQAGLGRPAVHFDRLLPLKPNSRAANLTAQGGLASRKPAAADAAAAAGLGLGLNPSYLNNSAVIGVLDLAVWISSADNPYYDVQRPSSNASCAGVVVAGNVLGGSFDVDTCRVDVRGSVVAGNLAWGAVKDMSGKSKFDNLLPASFR